MTKKMRTRDEEAGNGNRIVNEKGRQMESQKGIRKGEKIRFSSFLYHCNCYSSISREIEISAAADTTSYIYFRLMLRQQQEFCEQGSKL